MGGGPGRALWGLGNSICRCEDACSVLTASAGHTALDRILEDAPNYIAYGYDTNKMAKETKVKSPGSAGRKQQ